MSRRSSRAALAGLGGVLVGTLGCAPETLRVDLPPLALGRAAAVALEVGAEGRLQRVQHVSFFDRAAVEARGVLPFDADFPVDGDARISLLEYEDEIGLEDLGYPAGRVEPGADRPLDYFPAAVRELRLSSGEAGGWRARAEPALDGPLASFRLEDQQPRCACFTGEIMETRSSTASTVFLAQLGDRRVVVGTEDGLMYWVTPDALRPIPAEVALPLARRSDGSFLVGGAVGLDQNRFLVSDHLGAFYIYELEDGAPGEAPRLVHVTPAGRWSRSGTEVALFRVRWMVRVGQKVFGLDEAARFGVLDLQTGQSEALFDLVEMPGSAFQHGAVAYSEALDEVVAGSVHSTSLLRYRDGRARLDPDLIQSESLSAAAYHPERGWFVGTGILGRVHSESAPGSWSSCDSQLGNSIGAMVPYRDGFIAGSTQGFIEQYSARDGWCQKLQPASNSIRFMVPYATDGTSFVVIGPKLEERMQLYATVTVLQEDTQAACDEIRNPGGDPLPTCSLSALP